MDRLDYLNRDSFFTGVVDGKVSWDRLLKTLDVHDDNLVVEFKGIYSIENFLIARRLMYWQVYLHKNVICAGEMLIKIIQRAKELTMAGKELHVSEHLHYFLSHHLDNNSLATAATTILHHFDQIDDIDILAAIKTFSQNDDFILSYLSQRLLERKLLRIDLRNKPINSDLLEKARINLCETFDQIDDSSVHYLIFTGKEANMAYKKGKTEIQIKLKDNTTKPISEWQEHSIQEKEIVKFFACYPKKI